MRTFLTARIVWAAAAMALALALGGCGHANATPEAAFKKMQDAVNAKDYGAMFDCLTEKDQNGMVEGLALSLGFASMDPDKGKDAKAIVDKYGVGAGASSASLGSSIKDKRGFVSEATSWIAANTKDPNKGLPKSFEGMLTDLKIDGDTATAKVKEPNGALSPVKFVKESGSWRIVMR